MLPLEEVKQRYALERLRQRYGDHDYQNVYMYERMSGGCSGHDQGDYCYCESPGLYITVSAVWTETKKYRGKENKQEHRAHFDEMHDSFFELFYEFLRIGQG